MWRDTVRTSNDGVVSVHSLRGVPVEVHERGSGAIVVFVHGEDGLLFSGPLIAGIATALGSQLSEDAKTAWRDAYADASLCMQTAYLPSQLAAATMAAAAAAAPAE